MEALDINIRQEYSFIYLWVRKQALGIVLSTVVGAIVLPIVNIESEGVQSHNMTMSS